MRYLIILLLLLCGCTESKKKENPFETIRKSFVTESLFNEIKIGDDFMKFSNFSKDVTINGDTYTEGYAPTLVEETPYRRVYLYEGEFKFKLTIGDGLKIVKKEIVR